MQDGVYFVFTLPPAELSDDEFSAWYDTHVSEVLEIPGFRAARRYWLAQAALNRPSIVFRHLGAYVLDGASAEPVAELGRRFAGGEMTTAPWFEDVRVEAFVGRALEDPEIDLSDHAYVVLSHAPRRFTTEEYHGWYYAHARENLTSDGFDEVWRYALTLDIPDRESPSTATHAAFYKVEGELPELREALKRSFEAGRVDIPEWMPEGEFHSYDCVAAAALSRSVAGASSGH
ncbi:MAG TPA: hypothetical protein VGI50_18775 [Solirubrobacteraceae bacterium]|jgi:hypothetical protein